jgi:hypothetical protein
MMLLLLLWPLPLPLLLWDYSEGALGASSGRGYRVVRSSKLQEGLIVLLVNGRNIFDDISTRYPDKSRGGTDSHWSLDCVEFHDERVDILLLMVYFDLLLLVLNAVVVLKRECVWVEVCGAW